MSMQRDLPFVGPWTPVGFDDRRDAPAAEAGRPETADSARPRRYRSVRDRLYEWTLRWNRHLNSLRAKLGLPYWSLSGYLKQKVKRAVSYVGDFESALAREARRRGVQGVVCGHIHRAELREIDGIVYANDGDWVESLTALVEHADGRLDLVDWSARSRAAPRAGAAGVSVPPMALAR